MTPCEKLGYKAGDKFEMLRSSCGFKKGQVVTLFEDDGSESPCFKGDNTYWTNADGADGACVGLHDVKPVSQRAVKPISKSKRQLAQLLIEAGVTQFPEGANWAAQDKCSPMEGRVTGVTMYSCKPTKPEVGGKWWNHGGNVGSSIAFIKSSTRLLPNWHQTVLSRDEFDQIVAETEPQYCESVMRSIPEPTVTPTLDQLLQDWSNADDYAQRKQTEADEAAAMRDERWQAVQARAGEMGVTVGRCEPVVGEPELVITDWRQLRYGDFIWVASEDGYIVEGEYEVLELERAEYDGTRAIRVKRDGFGSYWINIDNGWRFIHRP